ncbi:hypothetical protein HHK36_000963 [Tetracentron sinense]|uniref:Uncharacterized protein n=1 Tax=Tetracentron sinense TaxID=13715 RepID=A0A834ZT52_TETSI|nr:hypothetical protein HHK36_000963 [Tetracentron sinense]
MFVGNSRSWREAHRSSGEQEMLMPKVSAEMKGREGLRKEALWKAIGESFRFRLCTIFLSSRMIWSVVEEHDYLSVVACISQLQTDRYSSHSKLLKFQSWNRMSFLTQSPSSRVNITGLRVRPLSSSRVKITALQVHPQPSSRVNITGLQVLPWGLGPLKTSRSLNECISLPHHIKQVPICCTKLPPCEPSPVTYGPTEDSVGRYQTGSDNIYKAMILNVIDKGMDTSRQSFMQFKWLMWLLGPSVLLAAAMAPTLWLPLSFVFSGANIASLLSLVGLDCIFIIGATLFLLMADACARSKSQAPDSYRFLNIIASIRGFGFPLIMFLVSHTRFLQPQLPFISFAVLLGPYLLLVSIQMLTEMLTWHWESPVWPVTPIVYEAYRVLQLMRALKLGAEIGAPVWMMLTIRGMVTWWVLILGIQLMRVAVYTAQDRQQS